MEYAFRGLLFWCSETFDVDLVAGFVGFERWDLIVVILSIFAVRSSDRRAYVNFC